MVNSVSGCENKTSTRHRFPHPEKDRKCYDLWINLVANPKLYTMNSEHVYYSYRVCHEHFGPEDKSSNMYLKKTTVPSLNLPSAHLVDEPCTSGLVNIPVTDNIPIISEDVVIESSSKQVKKHVEEHQLASRDQLCVTPVREFSGQLLHSFGVTRSIHLIPKAKKICRKAKYYRTVASVYKTCSTSLKRRLQYAKNMFNTSKCGLRNEAISFGMQQLLRKATKPRGRRYSEEEKLMSLALYKTSGPGYRFLSKFFKLPSRRTLIRLLQKVPVDSGINEFLMAN